MRKTLLLLLLLFCSLPEVLSHSPKIDSLERILQPAEDTVRVNILVKLSNAYATTDLDKADSIAGEALALLNEVDYREGLIRCLHSLSYIRSSKGDYEEGLRLGERAIALSEKTGSKILLAQSYDNLFKVHFQKGEYQEALAAAEKSMELAQEINAVRLLAQGYDNLGIIQGIKGQHTEALEYFLKSLELFEETGDASKTGLALMHAGHTFELAGSYEKALDYLKRSLEVNRQIGNKFNEAWSLVNIGVTYSRMKQLDTALSYYERSLVIAEDINDHRLILTNLDNIGGKYSLMHDFENANRYLRRAYDLSEKSGKNSRTVYITGNLAENYLYMRQFDSARIFGEKQLELALNSGLISEQKVAYSVLAQIYDSLDEHMLAYKALQNYITVNDSIFNQEKSKQIEELREIYEAEQKEQAIANLEKEKNAEQFRRNTFAGVALLILLIGGLLYNYQRVKVKNNKELLKKEQEVDQMKSQFFANITHEFRTPLTLILGPIEMMKTEAENPKIHQHLEVMGSNASRLLELINQLLELTKLESGALQLRASLGNIVPLVKGVVMSFESIAQAKEIDLTVALAEDEILICYEREKLEKILVNLLANAIKFTGEKGSIQVKLAKNDQWCTIHVKDSGSGIPAHELDCIFDRFYQSGNQGDAAGTGIGLALVRELTALHHGSIRVQSEAGKGTEFIVQLPLGDAHLSEAEKLPAGGDNDIPLSVSVSETFQEETTVGTSGPDEAATSGNPLLLLIEDNADVRNYIIDILQTDYQILQAKDGEEGVEMALEKIPDIVISDVMMPKMDGYTVCANLKQNEKTSHIPILLLTARVTTEDKIQGLEKQADDYVTKPFVPRELVVRVQNLINSRRKLREKYQRELILRPSEVAVNSVEEQFVHRLLKIMEAHLGDEKFGVEQLAGEVGMSRSQIHRKMIALTNQSPNHFIRTFRLTRAMELLKKQAATASEIAYTVGFSSPSYFTKCFREEFGYPPGEVNQHT